MTVSLLLMMAAAILAAVVLYTFIGFIPGTDETGVLAPVTLAIILAGAPPHVVLAFFISAVVTLNLMNGIPTALVGLPGGVMSAPLMDHAMVLRNKGLASDTIRKMAVGSAIGTLISIPLSFLLAGLLLPMADWIKSNSDIVLAAGASDSGTARKEPNSLPDIDSSHGTSVPGASGALPRGGDYP